MPAREASHIVMALGFTSLVISGCEAPKGYSWRLQEGYEGWVRVDFAVAGAAPLSIEDGYRVLEVTESGVLQTSDALVPSPTKDVFLRRMQARIEEGDAPRAGFTINRTEDSRRVTHFAFFGSQAALERAQRDHSGDPIPGSLSRSGAGRSR